MHYATHKVPKLLKDLKVSIVPATVCESMLWKPLDCHLEGCLSSGLHMCLFVCPCCQGMDSHSFCQFDMYIGVLISFDKFVASDVSLGMLLIAN